MTGTGKAVSPRANQIKGFVAAWAGIVLDGVDSFIYALVLVPAMKELLPASGIAATTGNLGFYGSILFAVFLIGWGCAFLWGPLADRFGRVRTLMLAILCYSLFTFLGCVARDIWELGVFRLLAGFGIGGEFVGAAIFVAEEVPDRRRVMGAGVLNSGYYAGTFIAAGLNYLIGAHFGWRAMFAVGGAPAIAIAVIRRTVKEPERWRNRKAASPWEPLRAIITPEYRARTVLNCAFLLISMIGLWAGTVYAPGAVTQVALREGYSAAAAARIASWATMLLAVGTILGCFSMPWMADRFGRRGAVAAFYAIMAVSVALSFGYAFYLPQHALRAFITGLFFVGVGGGSFSVFIAWLPEQYRTECRGTAFAMAMSIGRFAAAGATFLVGAGISYYGSIGVPVAMTALAFVVGVVLTPFGVETRGRGLPE
ncbi:MAG: MFS transporter [Acidobacteriota bacterium]|nr:MFS transporter [Acidobacteriota bacterium]